MTGGNPEKEGGSCSLQSLNLDDRLFRVVVAEYFDRRAGSQKNRNDGGGGWSWGKEET